MLPEMGGCKRVNVFRFLPGTATTKDRRPAAGRKCAFPAFGASTQRPSVFLCRRSVPYKRPTSLAISRWFSSQTGRAESCGRGAEAGHTNTNRNTSFLNGTFFKEGWGRPSLNNYTLIAPPSRRPDRIIRTPVRPLTQSTMEWRGPPGTQRNPRPPFLLQGLQPRWGCQTAAQHEHSPSCFIHAPNRLVRRFVKVALPCSILHSGLSSVRWGLRVSPLKVE